MISSLTPGINPTYQIVNFVEDSASELPSPVDQLLSLDHWASLLNGSRIRPFVDITLEGSNTIRVPSAVHQYQLYVDTAKIYDDAEVDGTLTAGVIRGVNHTHTPLILATGDITLSNSQTGAIINSKPTGSNLNITLPGVGEDGAYFTIQNCKEGGTTTILGVVLGRGNVLGEQYSSCTIYWGGDSWYGIGDLI